MQGHFTIHNGFIKNIQFNSFIGKLFKLQYDKFSWSFALHNFHIIVHYKFHLMLHIIAHRIFCIGLGYLLNCKCLDSTLHCFLTMFTIRIGSVQYHWNTQRFAALQWEIQTRVHGNPGTWAAKYTTRKCLVLDLLTCYLFIFVLLFFIIQLF